jgi:hypothetical protein
VAALAFAAGSVLALAPPAAAAQRVPGPWVAAWSWQADGDRLPVGCAPYSGSSSAGVPWSPDLVSVAGGTLRLGAAPPADGRRATGSGIGCTGKAQRYGRVEVRARMPRGVGLVGRIAFWPSVAAQDSGWSGLTVPSADLSPAYATNGCGDRAYGASVAAHLAGAFHTYVLTWSPQGMSVSADGQMLYRHQESFDGVRWLGISLAATGAATAAADLVVDRIVAYRWVGPSTTPATEGTGDLAFAAVPPSGVTVPRPQAAGVVRPGGLGEPDGGPALAATLRTGQLSTPWLVGGFFAAACVVVGVVRAARSSRRRPVVP